jgi:hypothetical protein
MLPEAIETAVVLESVSVDELKAKLVAALRDKAEAYFGFLKRFIQATLQKHEFDHFAVGALGESNGTRRRLCGKIVLTAGKKWIIFSGLLTAACRRRGRRRSAVTQRVRAGPAA